METEVIFFVRPTTGDPGLSFPLLSPRSERSAESVHYCEAEDRRARENYTSRAHISLFPKMIEYLYCFHLIFVMTSILSFVRHSTSRIGYLIESQAMLRLS